VSFPFEALRRWPDVEAAELFASDAADRLILDESKVARGESTPGELVVIGDDYGALTLASLAAGGSAVRVHQDSLTGERALAANAAALGTTGSFASLPLDATLVSAARVVLLRLPRSLDALRDVAGLIAAHADPAVVVFAGGRVKHMTVAMNDVLREFFGTVDVTHARQKARVLIARSPRGGRDPQPRVATIDGVTVCAFGGAFAGPRIDIGTRLLLEHLPSDPPGGSLSDPLIDLACGTGVIATRLALRHPDAAVYASDQSAVAVASARATATANGVSDRVVVARDDALASRADGSASFVVLNPPFHSGAAVTAAIAPRLFADVARVLRPGGQLWCVWNSPLNYRGALGRIVGPTRQVARNSKFTVTVSTRRP
jgi:16S rRNA (guanine1207-N2)-methyltransferase